MNITSPANLFHALRRQMLWQYRLPLIIFTPKSLLRHPDVISHFEDLSEGSFRETIDDETVKPETVKTIVLSSGKLYFTLNDFRRTENRDDIALIRVEQLYPFPEKQIIGYMNKYVNATRYVWAQDEPVNMGAWPFIHRSFPHLNLQPVARDESASPAGGLLEQHNRRLKKIIDEIFI